MIHMPGGADDLHEEIVTEGYHPSPPGIPPGVTTAVLLDIDGTLVDTNYHHALGWYRALRSCGQTVPLWRIHRHMGMGGDHLIAALVDDDFEASHGDDVRDAESKFYGELIDDVRALPGATDLIKTLQSRGHPVVLASSAKEDEVDHYLELLDARSLADAVTTSADVEATKPNPDLVLAAMDKVKAEEYVMIGDSTWDCAAAKRAGVKTVALLTGGFHESELRDAGAVAVFESISELIENLDDLPLS